MQTIATDIVDQYVQDMCRNRASTYASRGQQGAAAIMVHVAQEFSLPLDTHFPVDPRVADDMASTMEGKGQRLLEALYAASWEATDAIEDLHPEPVTLTRLSQAGAHTLVEETQEGESWSLDEEATARFDRLWGES